jgi:aldose 1-epimerase
MYFRMKSFERVALINLVSIAVMTWTLGCKSHPPATPPSPTAAASANLLLVGGQKAIELRRLQSGTGEKPEFLSVTLLPGRGMNMFQLTAYLPGKGEVGLLASPALSVAAQMLNDGPEDLHGNMSFTMGGAFLYPFANRILGPLTLDKKTGEHFLDVKWHGRTARVLANWHGKLPGAPLHAIHGDLLNAKAQSVVVKSAPDGSQATAIYDLPANGQWFSDNKVEVTITLSRDTVTATITGTNSGQQPEPVGIGWHPYFQLPSGVRANARLHIPSPMRVEVNNYDDVFPTGKLLPVMGTPYDFNAVEGAPLPDQLLDDSFLDLKRDSNGYAVVDIRDLGTNYGMRVTAMTPKVRAIQAYSPTDKSFIALEPQFNYGDPFGQEWHGVDTGMVTLAPGESVTWKTQLQLFQPANEIMGNPPHPQLQ